jgi:hypothetical protein
MSDEPIEDYLDALWPALPGEPREARRTLAEVESHLHEAAEAHEATGLDRLTAERRAVADFGTVAAVVPPLVVRDLIRPTVLLAGVGLLAVGASGLLAWLMRLAWGVEFLAGSPGAQPGHDRCAALMAHYPASDCLASLTLNHADEIVSYRLAAGFLGLLLLVALRWLPRGRSLPSGLVDLLGAVAFGVAFVALVVLSYEYTQHFGNQGTGQWASAAVVSLVAAGTFVVRGLQTYRPVENRPVVSRS